MAIRGRPRLVTIEDAARQRLLLRLRRVEGQVKGVQKMVTEGRYCIDVLEQLSAVDQAVRSTAKAVLSNYLRTCATNALRSGDSAEAQRVYQEITDNFFRFAR
jgi:DNA-binding FrmR family transcriptional regulator